jgi:hypothetical protein
MKKVYCPVRARMPSPSARAKEDRTADVSITRKAQHDFLGIVHLQ